MLNHTTLNTLRQLRLPGMVQALEEQLTQPPAQALAFEERLGLLVDRELTHRQNMRLGRLLKEARLKQAACIEDIDYRSGRGLEKSQMASLASGDWIRAHQNLLICGPTGVGKSYLACALGNQACRQGLSVLYLRAPRLIEELRISHADGSYAKRLARFAKTDLIVRSAAALSKHSALPCAKCLRSRGAFFAPTALRSGIQPPAHNGSTLGALPSYRGLLAPRFALHGSALESASGRSPQDSRNRSILLTAGCA
jgi:hypothetical protein